MDLSLQKLTDETAHEVGRAMTLFPSIHNLHEALGVIREEYVEFEKEVFDLNIAKGRDTRAKARKELIQLAAMCFRSILELNLPK